MAPRALADRLAEQAALLPEAALHVKPGGRLVYVTCSMLPEENGTRSPPSSPPARISPR